MMRYVFTLALSIALGLTCFSQNTIWVDGYYKSNGTYVQGHYKTAPDRTIQNNYSNYGNTNPYTKTGS